MDIAYWTAIFVVAWMTLSVSLTLIIRWVAKYGDQKVAPIDQQVAPMGPGRTVEPALSLSKRTSVWRSTVAADGHVRYRQVA
jgi:hypothetical protein